MFISLPSLLCWMYPSNIWALQRVSYIAVWFIWIFFLFFLIQIIWKSQTITESPGGKGPWRSPSQSLLILHPLMWQHLTHINSFVILFFISSNNIAVIPSANDGVGCINESCEPCQLSKIFPSALELFRRTSQGWESLQEMEYKLFFRSWSNKKQTRKI